MKSVVKLGNDIFKNMLQSSFGDNLRVFHCRRCSHIHSVRFPEGDRMTVALQKTVEVKCNCLGDHSKEIRLNGRSYVVNRVTEKTQNGIQTKGKKGDCRLE